jgi:hypothetical protein
MDGSFFMASARSVVYLLVPEINFFHMHQVSCRRPANRKFAARFFLALLWRCILISLKDPWGRPAASGDFYEHRPKLL